MSKLWDDVVRAAVTDKRVEPQKRMVGGQYGWAIHRFPIKGGASLLSTVIADNVMQHNALLKRIAEWRK